MRRYRLALRESVNYIQKNLMLKLDQLPKETLFNLASTSAGYTVSSSMPRCGRILVNNYIQLLSRQSIFLGSSAILYPLRHLEVRYPLRRAEIRNPFEIRCISYRPTESDCSVLRCLDHGWDCIMKLNFLAGYETWSFGGLVLGFIDADFCDQIHVGKLLTRFTNSTCFSWA